MDVREQRQLNGWSQPPRHAGVQRPQVGCDSGSKKHRSVGSHVSWSIACKFPVSAHSIAHRTDIHPLHENRFL